jgi:hypothetical protein
MVEAVLGDPGPDEPARGQPGASAAMLRRTPST